MFCKFVNVQSAYFYTGLLHQQDGLHEIDIMLLLFSLDKGHVPENFYKLSDINYVLSVHPDLPSWKELHFYLILFR